MNATDELRALLDERGVGHYDGTEMTLWGYEPTGNDVGCFRYAADETANGRMQVRMFHLTPTQAIAATLGRGTCYDLGDSTRFVCSECGCSLDLSDLDGEPTMWVNDIADTPDFCPRCGAKVVDG